MAAITLEAFPCAQFAQKELPDNEAAYFPDAHVLQTDDPVLD